MDILPGIGILSESLRKQGVLWGKREFLREDQGAESSASPGEPMSGDRYWRYDLGKRYGEIKYPLPLSLRHLTGKFASGIDTTP
jgi:hypothetical protein